MSLAVMYACPKFSTCSAPICPMHPDWRKQAHLHGESVCLWLRELQKDGGNERVRGVLVTDQLEAVLRVSREVMVTSSVHDGLGDVRRRLKAAARNGSKLASGRGLDREKAEKARLKRGSSAGDRR